MISPDDTINPSHERGFMILLVDDQIMIAEAIRRMLVDASDINFHYCSNPEEAVNVAKQVKPAVILQDLVMPNVSGLRLLRQYRDDPSLQDAATENC